MWPAPTKSNLNPTFSSKKEFDGYAVQGVTLETMPGFFLTGTLFLPEGNGPFPAVLSPHGHWSTGRFEHSELASIPGRAIHLAQNGFVVFNYSMIGYNEFENLFPHRFDDSDYQLWGFSAAGLQTWNSYRALDFIEALPYVNPSKIGMTGASGGGTQTFMLTAIDKRIKVAAPVNMISAHFQGGCICENAPALRLQTNNVEIGALAAPRPLLLISTSGDWTTNTPNVEYPAIKAIYKLFDKADQVQNVHLDYPHNYNEDSRKAMYSWFGNWLADDRKIKKEQQKEMPADEFLRAPIPDQFLSTDELFQHYKSAESSRLNALRPHSWASLDRYLETYKTPMAHVLNVSNENSIAKLEELLPAYSTDVQDVRLIVHGETTADQRTAIDLATHLKKEGTTAVLINPFSIIEESMPPDSIAYHTTYNPTTPQLRIKVIQEVAELLNQREDIRQIDLHGVGDAGAITFLARTQLPFVRHTHIDFNARRFASDDDFLQNLNIPLVRKAGDLRTAAALTFPSSLTLEALPHGALKNWIFKMYRDFDALEKLTFIP